MFTYHAQTVVDSFMTGGREHHRRHTGLTVLRRQLETQKRFYPSLVLSSVQPFVIIVPPVKDEKTHPKNPTLSQSPRSFLNRIDEAVFIPQHGSCAYAEPSLQRKKYLASNTYDMRTPTLSGCARSKCQRRRWRKIFSKMHFSF